MKMKRFLPIFSAVLCGTALSYIGPSVAQDRNTDQVGLVVPAFFSDDQLGHHVAYIVKNMVQVGLSSQDPKTGIKGIGRGVVHYVPAAMREPTHGSAARLARLNGFQGTVWGYTKPLADGAAIQSFLTIAPPYEDFRDERREIWSQTVAGRTLALGPPQLAVAFTPSTFSLETISRYGDVKGIEYCRTDGSGCVNFSDHQITRIKKVENDRIIVRRARVDYSVEFPMSDIRQSEMIDYSGIFVAYARGNLNDAVRKASSFLEKFASTALRIDALLYRAAANSRLKSLASAQEDIASALELNPLARRTLRYGILVELVAKGEKSERAMDLLKDLYINYGFKSDFDKTAADILAFKP